MLTNRTLTRINNRPRGIDHLPLLAVGGGALVLAVLAALAYAWGMLPSSLVLSVAGVGALLVLLLYARQRAKMTIRLSYKGNLDGEAASRFSEVREVLEGLASSGRVWSLGARAKRPRDASEPVPAPERDLARVGLLPTPGIKADVPVWGIEAREGTVFFFPEGALLYKNGRYEPVSYDALKVAFYSGRFFEEEDLPEDAEVVGKVWRFSRPDGSPDPRHKNDNAQIPIVLYGLLGVKGASGLNMRLMVSDRRAAARFARAFGAEVSVEEENGQKAGRSEGRGRAEEDSGRPPSEEKQEERRSAEDLEREARLAAARKTLGVRKGASAEQIGAAYKELARTYHPDKVEHLEPEAREYSEQRMKEINAAYAELRGRGGSVAYGRRQA